MKGCGFKKESCSHTTFSLDSFDGCYTRKVEIKSKRISLTTILCPNQRGKFGGREKEGRGKSNGWPGTVHVILKNVGETSGH